MGLNVHYTLSCDHCGKEVGVRLGAGRTLADAVAVVSRDGEVWSQADHEHALCPDCYPAYLAMEEAHSREVEEFFTPDGR